MIPDCGVSAFYVFVLVLIIHLSSLFLFGHRDYPNLLGFAFINLTNEVFNVSFMMERET